MPGRPEEDRRAFESTAISLGIPRDHWEHPLVAQFVGFVTQAERLQEELAVAEARMPSQMVLPLGKQRELLDSPDLVHPLAERYLVAELLMRAVNMVLTMNVGKNYQAEPRRYIANKINVALRGFGYHVEEDKKTP